MDCLSFCSPWKVSENNSAKGKITSIKQLHFTHSSLPTFYTFPLIFLMLRCINVRGPLSLGDIWARARQQLLVQQKDIPQQGLKWMLLTQTVIALQACKSRAHVWNQRVQAAASRSLCKWHLVNLHPPSLKQVYSQQKLGHSAHNPNWFPPNASYTTGTSCGPSVMQMLRVLPTA